MPLSFRGLPKSIIRSGSVELLSDSNFNARNHWLPKRVEAHVKLCVSRVQLTVNHAYAQTSRPHLFERLRQGLTRFQHGCNDSVQILPVLRCDLILGEEICVVGHRAEAGFFLHNTPAAPAAIPAIFKNSRRSVD